MTVLQYLALIYQDRDSTVIDALYADATTPTYAG
jgi:hypothetical protein